MFSILTQRVSLSLQIRPKYLFYVLIVCLDVNFKNNGKVGLKSNRKHTYLNQYIPLLQPYFVWYDQ